MPWAGKGPRAHLLSIQREAPSLSRARHRLSDGRPVSCNPGSLYWLQHYYHLLNIRVNDTLNSLASQFLDLIFLSQSLKRVFGCSY